MKQPILLTQFEYSIPVSAMALAAIKDNHTIAEHLPLMKVNIDFENGILKLEGDWNFMMASNMHNESSWFTCHRERVEIETTIYSDMKINLNDPYCDGLVFPMKGSIRDGNCLGSCSGLLVIDNVRGSNGLISNQWNISFYLYDAQFNDCEIKFKLSLYQTPFNENYN